MEYEQPTIQDALEDKRLDMEKIRHAQALQNQGIRTNPVKLRDPIEITMEIERLERLKDEIDERMYGPAWT